MEMDEPPVGSLPSLLDSCSSGRMGRALALGPQTQTGIQTHQVLPFWFIIARAMAVVLIWFLWRVGRETILMITIVLRRMPCPLAVSQDSNQRRLRMSVHNPPRLVILAAIGLLRDEPSAISTLEYLPRELYPPLFMAAIFGRPGRQWRPWCLPGPLPTCLCGAWCKSPTKEPYKQCWMVLMSCLPRRFTPGELDTGSLARSWMSWKRHLVPGRVDDQAVDQRLLKRFRGLENCWDQFGKSLTKI